MTNIIKSNKDKLYNDSKPQTIDLSLVERIKYISNRRREVVNLYNGNDDYIYLSSLENL